MRRFLPHVVRQAQLLTRKDSELKIFLIESMRKLSEFRDEEEKLNWLRKEVDSLLKESTENSKCKKGCHFCCFHPISLSKVEMNSILVDTPSLNQHRLEKQKDHFSNDTEIPYEERACVYLEDGNCTIYEKRPLICRLTHVSSLPENCHWENEVFPIEHLPVTKAALLVGAFYMGHPEVEVMPLLIP